MLEGHLRSFCSLCDADEVVMFERATFLVISHTTLRPQKDVHRFEKVSNIIKQFKLSCRCVHAHTRARRPPFRASRAPRRRHSKTQSQFESMVVRNAAFTAFIDYFTTNTYVMVIVSNPGIRASRAPALAQAGVRPADAPRAPCCRCGGNAAEHRRRALAL